MASTTLSADRHVADQGLRLQKLGGVHHLAGLGVVGAGRRDENLTLGQGVRVVHVDLHEEAVQLRLRKGIGAFLFEGVLGRQDVERRRQGVVVPGHRYAVLLHGLEEAPTGCAGWRG